MSYKTPLKLWSPALEDIEGANLTDFMRWLNEDQGLTTNNYHDLWEWSVGNIAEFWESIWRYFNIESDGNYHEVISGDKMPRVKWFEGASINYAEHIFRQATNERPAIIFQSEMGQKRIVSWSTLTKEVAAVKAFFESRGVKKGDCVAAYIPNIPEATIAFLAVNALGAIWSSVSPDFGTSSVVDRFNQIEPKVLIAVDGCTYGGKEYNKTAEVDALIKAISSFETIVYVPYLLDYSLTEKDNVFAWNDIIVHPNQGLSFERVPFSHPIWILYSSGTTGLPKAITHSQGGVLLEHLKYLTFHNDIKPGDKCFWYTTTGWMMWNYIQAALLCGATIVLYDGSPAYPDIHSLWRLTEEIGITHFGTSAGFINACIKKDIHPGEKFDLSALRSIGSTGSPLAPEAFDWIYKEVKPTIWLTSISGGTDVCSAFVGGNPLWPVYQGEIQCRALGCKLEAFNDDGAPVTGEMGEMVISKPMPSMPIYFWNDFNYSRYQDSYFELFPGIWRHGDWTEITERNGVIIYGRSDSTLNRSGIRIGTSEIYRALAKISDIEDCMVVFYEKNGKERMPLFVVMSAGKTLSDQLISNIKKTIRETYTSRHVPDRIIQVDEIPYTISGKKMETPVKRILMGMDVDKVINRDAMSNPQSLDSFMKLD